MALLSQRLVITCAKGNIRERFIHLLFVSYRTVFVYEAHIRFGLRTNQAHELLDRVTVVDIVQML